MSAVPSSSVPLDDPSLYFNRELSWLEFNRRVLEEARDASVPLLERLKFLAIFESNLDEFFMVRVGGLQEKVQLGIVHGSGADRLPVKVILERIAEDQKIEDEPADYDHEITLIAAQSGESVRRVRAQLEKQGLMDTLRNQIVERKVIELILSSAKFKDVAFELEPSHAEAIDQAAAGGDEEESNIPEAELLTGMRILDAAAADRAILSLRRMGSPAVLLKGGHLDEGECVIDRYDDGHADATFMHDRLPIEGHGTGCTLASAIAANLCRGMAMPAAVEAATDYIERALRGGYRPGRGEVVVLDHFGASALRTA